MLLALCVQMYLSETICLSDYPLASVCVCVCAKKELVACLAFLAQGVLPQCWVEWNVKFPLQVALGENIMSKSLEEHL